MKKERDWLWLRLIEHAVIFLNDEQGWRRVPQWRQCWAAVRNVAVFLAGEERWYKRPVSLVHPCNRNRLTWKRSVPAKQAFVRRGILTSPPPLRTWLTGLDGFSTLDRCHGAHTAGLRLPRPRKRWNEEDVDTSLFPSGGFLGSVISVSGWINRTVWLKAGFYFETTAHNCQPGHRMSLQANISGLSEHKPSHADFGKVTR